MFKKTLELNLQLFSEGGAEGVSGTSAQSDGESLSNVLYGTQNDVTTGNGSVTENQTEQTNADDLDAEFAGLIKKDGKYGKQYQKEISKHLGERTKNLTKQKQEAERAHQQYAESVNPLVESLKARYNLKTDDLNEIKAAIDGDADFYENAALANGMSSAEYKAKIQNEQLQKQIEENHKRQVNNERISAWVKEAEQLQSIYPNFNLEEELYDPAFASLLSNGFPMQKAYEAVHIDDILSGATAQMAQSIENKVANSVKANKARPDENGVSSQSASKVVRNSVQNLSYKDMDEINKRILAGEKITFRK